jgi:heat shock protein HslJ
MKRKEIILALAITFILLSGSRLTAAQSQWLDMNPLPSWNERKRAILQTKKISPAELKRCSVAVRSASLPQDFLLTKMGWTLTGAAQVFGKTAVITTAEAFDGQCRPLKFETYVFVGNRLAGTLSDGYLVNTQLTTEKSLTAQFARYRASDALCCPYKIENVTYAIKPDGANFLLVPEGKFESSVGGGTGNTDNKPENALEKLENTVWRWESSENFQGKIVVDQPENYQIEFQAGGRLRVKADCNNGNGSYSLPAAGKISLTKIAVTRRFCGENSLDSRFLQGLERAATFRIEDGALILEAAGDNPSLRFSRVPPSGGQTSRLENTVWRWQSAQTADGEIKVDKPENYEIRFKPNGELEVKADCNGGGGKYQSEGSKLTVSTIIRTQIFCGENSLDNRYFVPGLESARSYRIENNMLTIESEKGVAMRFIRVFKQN